MRPVRPPDIHFVAFDGFARPGRNPRPFGATPFLRSCHMNDSRIPETVLKAISEGTHIIRAYREHLGYSIEKLAIACGLAAEEIENIESGLRYNKGYRDRIARSLLLPAGIFDEESDVPNAA
jgi:DNA-binding XRE family transcriptional regulator